MEENTPANLILQDSDFTVITNSVASFCSTSWQASAITFSIKAHIESIQLVSQKRVSYHHHSGFASERTDSSQSLLHSSGVIKLEMRLHLLAVPEFIDSHCALESITRCFVLTHIPKHNIRIHFKILQLCVLVCVNVFNLNLTA